VSFNFAIIKTEGRFYDKTTNFYFSTDATAALSIELEKAAVNVIWPTIADQLMTASQWASSV
jgi:hypothetical protein